MAEQTLTLKLPFLNLNQCKKQTFASLTQLNTQIANEILTLSKQERQQLTSKHFNHLELGSIWVNQTIRNANAKTKVKHFKVLPLEINNQGWSLHQQGDTFSVCFNLYRGRGKKRIPLEVHCANHQKVLQQLLSGKASAGSLKLFSSSKGIWYALISVTLEVPESTPINGWIGVDRGQNYLAVASLPNGRARFFGGGGVKQLRRHFASRRQALQKEKKHQALKKHKRKERRIMTHLNHQLSKELVKLAKESGCGLSLEDLKGIRKGSKQRKSTKSDSGQNRDYWSYEQLERFVKYKANRAGVAFRKLPAAYTSQSCHRCGVLGKRKGHEFKCQRCEYRCHADWNASQVLGKWEGFHCSLELKQAESVMDWVVQESGVYEAPLNPVSSVGTRTGISV